MRPAPPWLWFVGGNAGPNSGRLPANTELPPNTSLEVLVIAAELVVPLPLRSRSKAARVSNGFASAGVNPGGAFVVVAFGAGVGAATELPNAEKLSR